MEKAHKRTECGCIKCTTCCEIMPGYLLPADLLPFASGTTGKSIWEIKEWSEGYFNKWALAHLLASDGSMAWNRGNGAVFRVETLVPRGKGRDGHGECMNLIKGGCAVHTVSPWACRMFSACKAPDEKGDADMARENELSVEGFRILIKERESEEFSLYYTLWEWLNSNGGKHPASAKSRRGRLERKLNRINK